MLRFLLSLPSLPRRLAEAEAEIRELVLERERIKHRVVSLGIKWSHYDADAMMYFTAAGEAVTALLNDRKCSAVAMVKGVHAQCDWPVDEYGDHDGWAHTNREYELVWTDHIPTDTEITEEIPEP